MTKQQIINTIVPSTIKAWEIDVPHHTHKGKGQKISNMYWKQSKASLVQIYNRHSERNLI